MIRKTHNNTIPNRANMEDNSIHGPFRKIFKRGHGIFHYFSPGLLLISIPSLSYFGVFGVLGLFIGGFIQDWSNDEDMLSWIKMLKN